MSRRAPRPVSLGVAAFVDELAPLTLLAEVQRLWASVVGEAVAEQATPTADRGGTLTITCKSAVWAQELDLMGPAVVERLNSALGRDAVAALRCSSAPPRRWAAEG